MLTHDTSIIPPPTAGHKADLAVGSLLPCGSEKPCSERGARMLRAPMAATDGLTASEPSLTIGRIHKEVRELVRAIEQQGWMVEQGEAAT
jgi:hypothetical protein